MGLLRAAKLWSGVIVLLCASRIAGAGTGTLDNGIPGVGHVDVTMDDYGSFGRYVGPNDCDDYRPPNYARPDPMTSVAVSYLFIYGNTNMGGVELSGYKLLHTLLQGAGGTGLEGNYAALTRTVTTQITVTGGVAHSAFSITDAGTALQLDVSLDQRLVTEVAPATRMEQDYTITNNGPTQVILVWHAIWDMDILFSDSTDTNDFVGVGQGLCYLFMHNPGISTQAGSFADGGSEIGVPGSLLPLPRSAYVGAKEGVLPEGTLQPPFDTAVSSNQSAWTNYKMPATWVDELANGAKSTPGETGSTARASVAMEYQFALGPGQLATIRLRRHWGTVSLPCMTGGVNCGNGVVDPGELCDPGPNDSMDCNTLTCTPPACGDGVVNLAAGEQCESNGEDSADCNGTACTTPACGDGYLNPAAGEACDDGADTANCNLANCQPPACGDGIVNVAAGESCETGALCDTTTCTYQFSVGGGCAGCGAGGGTGSLWLAGLVAALAGRRRRPSRG